MTTEPAATARSGEPDVGDPGSDPRRRLMQGFTTAVAEKGYAATTIADIVAAARVSKRTFYQHFADKEDCLLATYRLHCDSLVDLLRGSARADRQLPWRERTRTMVHAYLSALDALPPVHRTLLLEIQAAGPRAFELRTRMQLRFAALLCELVQDAARREPEISELTPLLALGLVGGINELMLHAFDPYNGGGGESFTALTDTVTELSVAVISRLR